eukprot:NODE_2090_length_1514_cov_93.406902_g1989_i0.p1 GENE.NODE_2090_length_1514_cov_93.406902_g1989_i0~~NODE_2090_length_1514_cov_93.406902_g1989_i0.p1  ORF type:complete len:339 (-),score=26.81 NODE_2090_length_1514_cov_93.406902_g1989_i0:114-1130(-)
MDIPKKVFLGEYAGQGGPELEVDPQNSQSSCISSTSTQAFTHQSRYIANFGEADTGQRSQLIVDASRVGNEARYINDCKGTGHKSNAQLQTAWIAELGQYRIVVRSTANIPKGAEILVDYGDSYWSNVDAGRSSLDDQDLGLSLSSHDSEPLPVPVPVPSVTLSKETYDLGAAAVALSKKSSRWFIEKPEAWDCSPAGCFPGLRAFSSTVVWEDSASLTALRSLHQRPAPALTGVKVIRNRLFAAHNLMKGTYLGPVSGNIRKLRFSQTLLANGPPTFTYENCSFGLTEIGNEWRLLTRSSTGNVSLQLRWTPSGAPYVAAVAASFIHNHAPLKLCFT